MSIGTLPNIKKYFQGTVELDQTFLPVFTRKALDPENLPSFLEVSGDGRRFGEEMANDTEALMAGVQVLKDIFQTVFKLAHIELSKKEGFELVADTAEIKSQSYEFYKDILDKVQKWLLKPIGDAYREAASDMKDFIEGLFNREAQAYATENGLSEEIDFTQRLAGIAQSSFTDEGESDLEKLEFLIESYEAPQHPLTRRIQDGYIPDEEDKAIDLDEIDASVKALEQNPLGINFDEAKYLVMAALRLCIQDRMSQKVNPEDSHDRDYYAQRIDKWVKHLLKPMQIILARHSAAPGDYAEARNDILRKSLDFAESQHLWPQGSDFDEFFRFFIRDRQERNQINSHPHIQAAHRMLKINPELQALRKGIQETKQQALDLRKRQRLESYPQNETTFREYQAKIQETEHLLGQLSKRSRELREDHYPEFDTLVNESNAKRKKIWQEYDEHTGQENKVYLKLGNDLSEYRLDIINWLGQAA